jgi:hypothetical protein
MKPLPMSRPLLWNFNAVHVQVAVSRADLVRRFGEPHVSDEQGDGLGPEDYWLLECDCGLQVLLRSIRCGIPLCLLGVQDGEVTHALAHLALEGRVDLWRGAADSDDPRQADGWAVVRQDETGNRYDICVVPGRAHAECFARLMEARAHKQSYYVEPRGTPGRKPRSRPLRGWAVIRQDELGNREEMAVFLREPTARQFAESYESEPRHKQTYFVEPVGPAS